MELLKRNGLAGVLTLLMMMGLLVSSGVAVADDAPDFESTHRQAIHNDVTAQNKLGSMYAKGQGVFQSYSYALYWYRKAAELGSADAQYNLGLMYDNGEGVHQDYTQAIDWYTKAAKLGHETAQAKVDKILGDIESLKKSVGQGKAEAQVSLGDLYANGNGVPQDDKQATVLYRKAAEQGSATAQYKLGFMYAEGKGVSQDFGQSVEWYRKAIAQNNAAAEYQLGGMYHKGRGVPKDDVYAYAWISLAAAQGDKNAISNKGFAASLLTPEQLSQAQDLAAELQAKIDSKKP